MSNIQFDGLTLGQRSYIRKQFNQGVLVSQLCRKYGVEAETIIKIITKVTR